ncbi:hypothetical protein MVEN_01737600 [Mycena venus]|uniref:Uncharacterized protein n=1 Tax=Mycena venus TaxID=2733690 RepID=A0A8H6XMD4_9AGAR|nr:hypothetical protein MVEN_01737600 [Mycena venus]
MSCTDGGGPSMNTDISGIGVRVSFYLQTLFLGCLSARSVSLDEITGAFYTLLATNTGIAVTALILGFKSTPEISFHDALVVSYLLYISWVTVLFSLPSSARFGNKPGDVKILKILHFCSVIQSYAVFAFAFAMLATAPTFGSTPECNPNALVVLFRPFSALNAGRILFCVLAGLVCIAYTALLVNDHIVPRTKKMARILKQLIVQHIPVPDMSGEAAVSPPPPPKAPEANAAPPPAFKKYVPPSKHRERYNCQIDWKVVFKITIILILWGLAVMNTELLIRWNHFAASDGSHSEWQFGQVLPMFLVGLSLISVVTTFRENGIRTLPVVVIPPV